MDIYAIIKRLWLEIQAFSEAADRRAFLAERVGIYFDWIASQITIPGPDAWIRSLLLWVVDMVYTAVAEADTDTDDDSFWSTMPAAPPVLRVHAMPPMED